MIGTPRKGNKNAIQNKKCFKFYNDGFFLTSNNEQKKQTNILQCLTNSHNSWKKHEKTSKWLFGMYLLLGHERDVKLSSLVSSRLTTAGE